MPDYPQAEPIVRWQRPWQFDEWKAATLKGRHAGEELLQMLYSRQWEPSECNLYMQAANLFKRAPSAKTRRVALDMEAVQKRIALAIWKECGVLLGRNMESGARQFVIQTFDNAKNVVFKNDVEALDKRNTV